MPQSFDRDLLYVIHDVARLMRTKFDQRARGYGMTRAQWVILSRLENQPGLSQNEMAGIVEVEPITIARLIDRLQASGFVERRADPKDRRIWRLHLTAAAEPMLAEIKKHKEELRSEIMAGIDPATLDLMVDGLLKLKANLTSDGRTILRAV
jgi:MarR family transcriptional regulator for hemolysin